MQIKIIKKSIKNNKQIKIPKHKITNINYLQTLSNGQKELIWKNKKMQRGLNLLKSKHK